MSLAEAAGVLSADTTRDGMGAAPSPLVPPWIGGTVASSGRGWGSLCPLGQPPSSRGGSGCSLARMGTQDPWHGPGWLLHPRGEKRGGRVLGAGWGGRGKVPRPCFPSENACQVKVWAGEPLPPPRVLPALARPMGTPRAVGLGTWLCCLSSLPAPPVATEETGWG